MGQYLRRDHPLSLDPAARFFGTDYEWRVWGELQHSVRTGKNAAVHALGHDTWEHRRRHPEHGEVFDAAMRTLSRAESAGILAAHDFGRYGTVADVGGGTGAMLAAVLTAHPQTRGILFDQPHVVAGADRVLRDAGVAARVSVVTGNFFVEIPAGADAYILAHILHDWPDEDAVRILRRIRSAMTLDARLLLLEAVVGPPNEDPKGKFLDLMMLVALGGQERTEEEWRALLAAADLELTGITRATPIRHVIEAVPVG
jgi:O-methyltransferase domain